MLKDALQKLVGQKTTINSYDILRLQAKTYRLTKYIFQAALSQYGISTLEWMILGLLNESSEGLKFSEIAKILGVEPPFVTELVSKLEKQGILEIKESISDRRAKAISLTIKGKNKITKIKENVEKELDLIFPEMSGSEIQTYFRVMKKIETAIMVNPS